MAVADPDQQSNRDRIEDGWDELDSAIVEMRLKLRRLARERMLRALQAEPDQVDKELMHLGSVGLLVALHRAESYGFEDAAAGLHAAHQVLIKALDEMAA